MSFVYFNFHPYTMLIHRNVLVVNSTTKMMEIPYCNNFQVEERLVIKPSEDEGEDSKTCIM